MAYAPAAGEEGPSHRREEWACSTLLDLSLLRRIDLASALMAVLAERQARHVSKNLTKWRRLR
jgi:hypothetical protein